MVVTRNTVCAWAAAVRLSTAQVKNARKVRGVFVNMVNPVKRDWGGRIRPDLLQKRAAPGE